jgi:hypothetical protein
MSSDIEKSVGTPSVPLPPYRAVIAVDAEKFSRNADRYQQVIGVAIPRVLEAAFQRSGLQHIWQERKYARHSGDGYVLGTPSEYLPYLIHPFLDHLQDVLGGESPGLAALSRDMRLRLRVSIDVGPLPDTGGTSAVDAMGDAMINTHRLLDSDVVKRALADSHPDITLVAAILSRRAYEDAVLSGFSGVHASRLSPAHVAVPAKEYAAEAYLYTPTPSSVRDGHPDRGRAGAAEEAKDSAARAESASRATNTFTNSGTAENLVQGQTFNGLSFNREGNR